MDLFIICFAPKILSRCDLCLIQEVRDSKGEAIRTLVKDLNRYTLVSYYGFKKRKFKRSGE